MIKVTVIDDHNLFADGVKKLLEGNQHIECLDTFNSFRSFISSGRKKEYDVILLDINLDDENGIDVCASLKRLHPGVKVIALTMISEVSVIQKMINNGADGYLLKNVDQEELVESISIVMKDEMYLTSKIKNIIGNASSIEVSEKENDRLLPTLSRREKQVLVLIIKEFTTQEIADHLKIGFSTVETHRRNIGIKLGARNTAGIVRIALENKLIG
ncbi:MAG: response regulator transcription factor [Saprospiraceae bacterium]|nr:response regulator transcription factor [Saprospiraceae bacterium]